MDHSMGTYACEYMLYEKQTEYAVQLRKSVKLRSDDKKTKSTSDELVGHKPKVTFPNRVSNSPKVGQIKFRKQSKGRHIHYVNQRLGILIDTKFGFKRRASLWKTVYASWRYQITSCRKVLTSAFTISWYFYRVSTDRESTRQDLWF